ncbi:hypothetical protein L1049_018743 [Liquidambar formosana]|uniref:DNA (cytosine-5-)-methyltransferase n=1 Tax=Liquidambar formosana TaxID=63359 RepID=A0AAP0RBE7_LIQFO
MPTKRTSSPSSSWNAASSKKPKKTEDSVNGFHTEEALLSEANRSNARACTPSFSKKAKKDEDIESRFVGNVVPKEEARERWPQRYRGKMGKQIIASESSNKGDTEEVLQAQCHYTQAEVDGHIIFNLYDDAYVKAGDGEDNYICKIIEMFKAIDGALYFTAQWFYRARDTVIKDNAHLIDNKRLFFSEIKDDNPLDCLVEKLRIARVPLNVDLEAKKEAIPACDYYYDMLYLLPYSTFMNVPQESVGAGSETFSTISSEININGETCDRWAVDINKYACESLKLNHLEMEVRNESAEDFLLLLKEWEKLCISFSLISGDLEDKYFDLKSMEDDDDEDDHERNDGDGEDDSEVFEVAKILAICYGDPKDKGERGLYFKVSWKGYGPSEDSWEPIEGLGNCRESMKDFVANGYRSKFLPLPGDVDVICGGPPCQGISGFNRFRNTKNPLDDPKNEQLLVFMNVVDYLKPKFVLMENVVDLVKFSGGFLGRYALGRLIQMNYQTRMGLMAAGAYGLPQFRMRVFIWGSRPTEKLPQYPLPTHDVVVRGFIPTEFESHAVAYEEGCSVELERKLLLKDAISDLPPVTNGEQRDEMPYGQAPQTEFQQFIRLSKDELLDSSDLVSNSSKNLVYDHRPLELNTDDYERVCQIPRRKGANFRDLPGVRVRPDKKVEFDPAIERVLLRSWKTSDLFAVCGGTRQCPPLLQEQNPITRQFYILSKIGFYQSEKMQDSKGSQIIINFVGLLRKGIFKLAMQSQFRLPGHWDMH